MLQTTNLYSEARRRLEELKAMKLKIVSELKKAPPGRICVRHRKDYLEFYLRRGPGDKNGEYIRKSNRQKIHSYLQKAYYAEIQHAIGEEINRLEQLIGSSGNAADLIKQIYSNYPYEIKQNIEPIDCFDDDYVEKWLNIPYKKKPIDENLTYYRTEKGEYVRSKSELTIANALYRNGIPYKYECPLKLKSGVTVYPDFTVLSVSKRKELFWEHRGMMDDYDYARMAVKRVKEYMKNNIYTGNNLILTEETAKTPLGTNEIRFVIENIIKGD